MAQWIVWELDNAKPRYQCIAQFKDFAPHYFRSKYCQQELDAALTGDANRLLAVCQIGRSQECFSHWIRVCSL